MGGLDLGISDGCSVRGESVPPIQARSSTQKMEGSAVEKVVRLKLTCQECGQVGYVQINKRDLKSLRQLLRRPPQTKWGVWTRLNYHENES